MRSVSPAEMFPVVLLNDFPPCRIGAPWIFPERRNAMARGRSEPERRKFVARRPNYALYRARHPCCSALASHASRLVSSFG
jgi:hypothetical protein